MEYPGSCKALIAAFAIASLGIELPTLVDDDVLEPSIQNEVDHAISKAPTNAPPCEAGAFISDLTNGLNRTEIAIKLVSTQRADGRWLVGTNDVTSAALGILDSL